VPQICKSQPNEASITTICRPFRAGHFWDVFPGLKPRAESCSPFGTKTSLTAVPVFDSRSPANARLQLDRKSDFDGPITGKLEKVCRIFGVTAHQTEYSAA
jgi:hypothetical protein